MITRPKILVIGDIILDEYVFGNAYRLSQEAPVPIVSINKKEYKLGGAANVAANSSALQCDVDICGFIGSDENASIVTNMLTGFGITNHLILSKQTTKKTRIFANMQQLSRLDEDIIHPEESLERELINKKILELGKYDAIIVSDYAKGTICESTMLILKDKFADCRIFVDPKPSHYMLYNGVFCITPNRNEAEIMIGNHNIKNFYTDVIDLKHKMQLNSVVVTLSEDGLFLVDDVDQIHKINVHRCHNVERYQKIDVTGAGDTLISVLARCISCGDSILESVKKANVAAGIVVNKLGTAICSLEELEKELLVENNHV